MSSSRVAVLAICLFSCCVACWAAADPLYEAQFVFDPAVESHGHVHASAIVECPNGDLRVVWYENGPQLPSPPYYDANKDKSDDVRIGGSRKPSGADAWEPPFVASDTFGTSDNNPTMVIDRQQQLWLFHATMLGAPRWTWGSSLLQYKVSRDYQKPGPPVWAAAGLLLPRPQGIGDVLDQVALRLQSPETRLRFGTSKAQADALLKRLRDWADDPMRQRLGWMPRVHPLVRSDGTLIVPLSNENFGIPMLAMTADGGQTWDYSKLVPALGLSQPTLVELPDGSMTAFFRNGDPQRRIQRSTSTDGGLTWAVPELTDRPHPGSGIEAVLLRNGHLALVYNGPLVYACPLV